MAQVSSSEVSVPLEGMGSRKHAVGFPHFLNVLPHVSLAYPELVGIPERRTLFHYTDAGGLFGIIQGQKFWATHSAFLNDPTEGLHGLEAAKGILRSKLEDDVLRPLAVETLKSIESPQPLDLFTVSFCESGDLLSQWRGYGSFGSGYALGFDSTAFGHPQVAQLVRISYDDDLLRSVIETTAAIYRDHMLEAESYDLEDLGDLWGQALGYIAQYFKHAGYSEEKETRLVFSRLQADPGKYGEAAVSYRPRKSDVVPYLATSVFHSSSSETRLPLREVVLGPGVGSANLDSVRGLLSSAGYEDVLVRRSAIPFIP